LRIYPPLLLQDQSVTFGRKIEKNEEIEEGEEDTRVTGRVGSATRRTGS